MTGPPTPPVLSRYGRAILGARHRGDGIAVVVREPDHADDHAHGDDDHGDDDHGDDERVESTAVDGEPGRSDVTVRLSDVAPERVAWLWPGRLPVGKLVTLDGDPGTGKSTLAVEIAAHVSTGASWPDGTVCPLGDVLILSAEDGMADTIRPRLDAAEGDPSRVHCLTAVRSVTEDGDTATRPPTLADVAVIRDVIERTGARLVIIDVLMAYLPSRVDSHRDQDVRAVLHRVAEVAERTGCTVLLLRHLNKAGAGSPIYRGGGSIGIVGAARAGFVVAPDPDDETGTVRVLAAVKSNLAVLPPSLRYRLETAPGSHVAQLLWGGESAHAATLLRPVESDDERTERDDAAGWITDYLTRAGGAAPARDVLTAGRREGYSRSTLYRAAERAHVTKSKDGMRGGWTWRHPDDNPPQRPEDPTGAPEDPEGPSTHERRPSGPSRDLRGTFGCCTRHPEDTR